MAEHPGVMDPDEYDLSGFCVALVDRPRMLDPEHVREGDVLVGVASSGLHSNGYSLARRVCTEGRSLDEITAPVEELGGQSVADALLTPTRIYVKSVLSVLREVPGAVHALAHITGGGITENLNRALAGDVDAVVTRDGSAMGWDVPPVITYISNEAELAPNEACKTFNMGVGLCIICASEDEDAVTRKLVELGEKPFRVGVCTEGSGKVVYSDEQ